MTSKTVDEVYADRNALVLALATVAYEYQQQLRRLPANLRGDVPEAFGGCWEPDGGDDADADDWAVVYVHLPTGQASWHVPKELVEESELPRRSDVWDGHDRDEKNRRLASYYQE